MIAFVICDEVKESDCGRCGEISGNQVDCRVFEYEGNLYEVPPKAMLAEAILKKALLTPKSNCCECYELPENLKNFFKGKEQKKHAVVAVGLVVSLHICQWKLSLVRNLNFPK